MQIGAGWDYPKVMSRAAVARAFGISDTAVSKWVQSGCPQAPDKSFNLTDVIVWWGERERKSAREEGERLGASGGSTTGSPALERVREADALSRELKLLRDLGEVVDREKVEADWSRSVTLFTSILQSVPSRIAKRAEGKTAVEISLLMTDEIRDAVRQMDEAFRAAMSGEDELTEDDDA